jgi:hypothetical protein
MTDKTDPALDDVEADVGGDQQEVSIEDRLAVAEARAQKAEAEAAKHRGIRKQVEKERDEYKAKTKTSQDEDYKALYQAELNERSKLTSHVKTSAIKSAVHAQLVKVGVNPAFASDAVDLMDQSLIEWDLESGVDATSVTGAVQKFKSAKPHYFEKALKGVDPKTPADGGNNLNANTMTRSEFAKLDPKTRAERMQKGWKLTD